MRTICVLYSILIFFHGKISLYCPTFALTPQATSSGATLPDSPSLADTRAGHEVALFARQLEMMADL